MLRNMGIILSGILRDKKGQAVVEYGLIIVLVAVVVMVGIGAFGTELNDWFTNLTTLLGF